MATVEGVSKNNGFYSMISNSLSYWPEDDEIVESVSLLDFEPDMKDEKYIGRDSFGRYFDMYACLKDWIEKLCHLKLDLPFYKSTLVAGLKHHQENGGILFRKSGDAWAKC